MKDFNTHSDNGTTPTEAELFSRFMKLPIFPDQWTAEDLLRNAGGDDIGLEGATEGWIKQAHTSECPVADLEMVRDHLTGVLTHIEQVLRGYQYHIEVECDDTLTPRERVEARLGFFKDCGASGDAFLEMIEASVLGHVPEEGKLAFFHSRDLSEEEAA